MKKSNKKKLVATVHLRNGKTAVIYNYKNDFVGDGLIKITSYSGEAVIFNVNEVADITIRYNLCSKILEGGLR